MQTALLLHYAWAFVVIVTVLWAIWQPLGRRIALWALVIQLLLGIWVMATGRGVYWLHPALWLAAALLIQLGAILARRDSGPVPTLLVALGAACAALTFHLGQVSVAGGT
ncbi:hypothetical protein EPN42_14610 [bacterium]|nr:MAG: hypothetical protein EPN42_14610 [bacterium]